MRSILALILSWLKKLLRIGTLQPKPEDPVPGNTDPDDPVIDDPGFDRPDPKPGEVVCYYGCPNSKKAQKLQLGKQKSSLLF